MSRATPSSAMGAQDGDTLTIANQWASYVITREKPNPREPQKFWVGEDGHGRVSFPTMNAAVAYALTELTEFERGRVP